MRDETISHVTDCKKGGYWNSMTSTVWFDWARLPAGSRRPICNPNDADDAVPRAILHARVQTISTTLPPRDVTMSRVSAFFTHAPCTIFTTSDRIFCTANGRDFNVLVDTYEMQNVDNAI